MAKTPLPPPLPPMGPTGRRMSRRGVMLKHNNKIAVRRRRQAAKPPRRPILLDLMRELGSAIKPWRCPQCRESFGPPRTVYISPLDGQKRCTTCAANPT